LQGISGIGQAKALQVASAISFADIFAGTGVVGDRFNFNQN